MAEESYDMLAAANKMVNDLKESRIRILLVQAYLAHPDIAHAVDAEHAKMKHWDVAASSESVSNGAGGLEDEDDEKEEDLFVMGIRTATDRNLKVTEVK